MTKGQKASIFGFYCIFINKYFQDWGKLSKKSFQKWLRYLIYSQLSVSGWAIEKCLKTKLQDLQHH